jgi:hypothetical protein
MVRSLQEIQLDFVEEASRPKLGCGAKERRRICGKESDLYSFLQPLITSSFLGPNIIISPCSQTPLG